MFRRKLRPFQKIPFWWSPDLVQWSLHSLRPSIFITYKLAYDLWTREWKETNLDEITIGSWSFLRVKSCDWLESIRFCLPGLPIFVWNAIRFIHQSSWLTHKSSNNRVWLDYLVGLISRICSLHLCTHGKFLMHLGLKRDLIRLPYSQRIKRQNELRISNTCLCKWRWNGQWKEENRGSYL